MRLAEFIREALADIALGVHAAKADSHELVAIVPGRLDGKMLTEKSYVDFDIAVTASESVEGKSSSGGKAGLGISVIGIKGEIGAAADSSSTRTDLNSRVSRIAFKVPIYLNAHFRGDASSKQEAAFVLEKWDAKLGPSDT